MRLFMARSYFAKRAGERKRRVWTQYVMARDEDQALVRVLADHAHAPAEETKLEELVLSVETGFTFGTVISTEG